MLGGHQLGRGLLVVVNYAAVARTENCLVPIDCFLWCSWVQHLWKSLRASPTSPGQQNAFGVELIVGAGLTVR